MHTLGLYGKKQVWTISSRMLNASRELRTYTSALSNPCCSGVLDVSFQGGFRA